MSEQEFNYLLSWILLLNALPTMLGAGVCLLWLTIVKRRISQVIFVTGFVVLSAMTIMKIKTSYDFDSYWMRLLNGATIIIGGVCSNIPFLWAFIIQRRDRSQKESVRDIAERSLRPLDPDEIAALIHSLHWRDVRKLLKRFSEVQNV
jgi:hypothetical protein